MPLGNHMPTHVATIDVRSFMNLGDDSHETKSMKSMYILHIACLSLAYLKLTSTFTEYNVETFFLGGHLVFESFKHTWRHNMSAVLLS